MWSAAKYNFKYTGTVYVYIVVSLYDTLHIRNVIYNTIIMYLPQTYHMQIT